MEHGVNYELTIIKDGEAAIHWVEELETSDAPCPDLVVLDLNLPKKSGYEVLERFRANRKCGHIPVVILSSSYAPEDRIQAIALGCSRYLTKAPILEDFLKLGAVFKEILTTPRA